MRRIIGVVLICGWAATNVAAADYERYSQRKRLAIRSVRPDRAQVEVFERLTLDVDLEASYENAFARSQIRLDAAVAGPDGRAWNAPGFFYVPYRRDDSARDQRLTVPTGSPRWQMRLSFPSPGTYELVVTARDASGSVQAEPLTVEVTPADKAGMIRRHGSDRRYFATDRGETWFAVGANVCWGSDKHVFAYDDWFPQYAVHGCNYARIWLSLEWNDLALITQRSGYDRIDLQRAWHLDHVLELAEQHGLRLMLCFDAHGMLRSQNHLHGFWEQSPLHPDHGAPIQRPIEFFTNAEMLEAYRNRLWYLVARYGYSTSVFAWEFFNEVDLIDDYDSQLVANWHRQMATYLRGIDPWKHLITTSFANSRGDPTVDRLAELDFVQTHHYQAGDIAAAFQKDIAGKAAAAERPHFHGEFGISHSGSETGTLDPNGIHLHNGLYSSVGLMAAGTPMTWWWDSYVHPRNLYPIWGSFARWIEGFDFIAQQAAPVEAAVSWSDPQSPRALKDFILNVSDVSWSPAPFNQPTEVTIDAGGGATYDVKPAGILHGLRNHPDLHNPVTFHLELPEATSFIVDTGGVSGYGGAILQIQLDGREMLKVEMIDADNPNKGGTLTQFAGSYEILLPSGRHTVVVRSIGKDWLMVNAYRIPGLVLPEEPPLRVLGVAGATRALLWLQSPDYTWSSARRADFDPYVVTNSRLTVRNLAPGRWIVEHWDAHAGQVTDAVTVETDAAGSLDVELPPITWDHALRLKLQ
ncbi:MAG: hypothetical protein JW741_21605 [Sedimentisphaerales bacterium]|nr:hypothetical protein [Sedimentisphaerales bacterium]